MMHNLGTYELSESQAISVLAALDALTEEQLQGLMPATQDNLKSIYQNLRTSLVCALTYPS